MSSTQDSLTDFGRMACDQAGIYNRKTRASTHNVGVYDVPSPLLLGLESLLAQCLSVPPVRWVGSIARISLRRRRPALDPRNLNNFHADRVSRAERLLYHQ